MTKRVLYYLKLFWSRPIWVLTICLLFISVHIGFDGTLLRIWHLYGRHKELRGRIVDIQEKNSIVEKKLKQLSNPRFLIKEARDRFNIVGEGDIVFIFSDQTELDKLNKKEKP